MKNISFFKYVGIWISTTVKNTISHFWGRDAKTAAHIFLFISGFFFLWDIQGELATKDELTKWILLTALPLMIVFGFAFMVNLIQTPYLIYKEQEEKNKKLEFDLQEALDDPRMLLDSWNRFLE